MLTRINRLAPKAVLRFIPANMWICLLVISLSSNRVLAMTDTLSHDSRPNIVLIMADDLGFSDIGCYGGEVETPQLNELAKNGLRYRQFYNAARCCPSRAALMTGLYPHQAGMGWMAAADMGTPAYAGNLNNNSVTIAEVLRSAGYSTYMSGKWHLTNERKIEGKVIDNWPIQRGFDRYFGIIPGGANYFKATIYSNNRSYRTPKNFYLTNAISDTSIAYIREHAQAGKKDPFFLYVAYTAPHWPLHALKPEIDKYVERYKKGWDVLRQERFKKIREIGLIRQDNAFSPRDSKVQAWDRLSDQEKEDMTMRMAIYAAQIDLMDQGIKHIVDELKKQGQFENTLIFFLSDNGACAEYISREKEYLDGTKADSYESYRQSWANLSSTPFREYKHYVHEGGIASPLIVHWPKGIRKDLNNSFIDSYGHIIDLMATCADVAGASYPEKYNGHTIQPLEGKSLAPQFVGKQVDRGKIFWEHEANIAMRDGKWKMVAKTKERTDFDKASLELYDMDNDPSELYDLAKKYPKQLEDMYKEWHAWAERIGAFPLDTRTYGERAQAYRRMINGDFEDRLGDWKIYQAERGLARIEVDTKDVIQGRNTAKITVQRKASNTNAVALRWPYPAKKGEKFRIELASKANRPKTTLTIAVEPVAGGRPVLNEQVEISGDVAVYRFETERIPKDEGYRVSLKFGDVPVATSVWVDDIKLTSLQ